jgi:transcriptional activator of cad operon
MPGLGITTWLFLFHGKFGMTRHAGSAVVVPPSQRSVAVLPFLDLTEGMKQGEFTDGMTEELIDKLSKVPSLRVPPPTSSFYFKDKQVSVADVADKLGVAYVLDGSVRKSGAKLRVAARLVRADTGYVIWSETYDRPWHYTLMMQDDIARDLTEAVKASLGEQGSNRR